MALLYVLGVLLVLAAAQALLFARRALRRLDYDCRFDVSEAVEGQTVHLVETVSNRKALPLPWLRSEIATSQFLDYAHGQSYVTDRERFVTGFFLLRPYQRIRRSWHITCRKRGVYPIRKCILLSTDLLGLRATSREVAVDTALAVLPQPADLELDYRAARRVQGDIVVRRHYLEDPFQVAGVRAYTPRDALNRIHWGATAKTGELMVRDLECTAEENLLVVLNMQSEPFETGRAVHAARIETAIRACAGYFENARRIGVPVRFACNAAISGEACVVTEEFGGEEHVLDLHRLLARLPDGANLSFPTFLQENCRKLDCSELAIVTSYLQPQIFDFAREKQAQGAHVRILCIAAVAESELPDDLDVFVYQGEERESL